MAKKIIKKVKLQIMAAKATPAPPLGPALGQAGINIGDFVTKFNAATKNMAGDKVGVQITVYEDRTFSFIVKKPPVAVLIKKTLNLEKGAATAGKQTVAKLSKSQVKKIAEEKMDDLNASDIDAAMRIVEGSARSMGVEVTD